MRCLRKSRSGSYRRVRMIDVPASRRREWPLIPAQAPARAPARACVTHMWLIYTPRSRLETSRQIPDCMQPRPFRRHVPDPEMCLGEVGPEPFRVPLDARDVWPTRSVKVASIVLLLALTFTTAVTAFTMARLYTQRVNSHSVYRNPNSS